MAFELAGVWAESYLKSPSRIQPDIKESCFDFLDRRGITFCGQPRKPL
jgi:hypothetical protein